MPSKPKPLLTRGRTVQELNDLTGRVAVITGGAGLLGLQHASAIMEAGGTPILVDLRADAAKEAAAALKDAYKKEAAGFGADITDPAAVAALARTVQKRFGRVDILINNAALTVKGGSGDAERYFAPFESYPLHYWEAALKVNLTGAFLVTQAFGKLMARRRRGVILNIASDVGNISPDHRIYEGVVNPHTKKPFNTPLAYATSKAALINFTRYLATYWAPRGLRVNCLSPGGVFQGHEGRFLKQLTHRIPLGRMARFDEYKGAVLFLVSNASSYMTGANLIVDGGRTCW